MRYSLSRPKRSFFLNILYKCVIAKLNEHVCISNKDFSKKKIIFFLVLFMFSIGLKQKKENKLFASFLFKGIFRSFYIPVNSCSYYFCVLRIECISVLRKKQSDDVTQLYYLRSSTSLVRLVWYEPSLSCAENQQAALAPMAGSEVTIFCWSDASNGSRARAPVLGSFLGHRVRLEGWWERCSVAPLLTSHHHHSTSHSVRTISWGKHLGKLYSIYLSIYNNLVVLSRMIKWSETGSNQHCFFVIKTLLLVSTPFWF